MNLKTIPEQPKDESNDTKDPMQILEEALTLCKFGKFHIRLLAATLCSAVSLMMVTTTTSYILPIAECDLKMNIMHKGILNGMPFFGQIGASLFAGFLIDSFGRRIFLVGGNGIIFICTLIEGSSQSYIMLLLTKLLEGIALSLCFCAISTYLSELCHLHVRDRLLIMYSGFLSVALIIAALSAWVILPIKFNYTVLDGYFELHSWNLFLYFCSIWSLFAFVIYLSLPETPKYLLSHGREKEALEVLKGIYSENTGNKEDTFPVKSLNTSGTVKPTKEISLKKQIVTSLFEAKELFRKPLVFKLILFSFITFSCLIVFTSLRLWFPQLSTIVENYGKDNGESARFCVMINGYMQNLKPGVTNATEALECVPQLSGSETYTNGLILGFAALISVGISAFLVDYFGQKVLMFVILILSTICSTALYWTNAPIQIALLISCTCALLQAALCLQQNLFVRFFPTNLRALAVSIIIMIGRVGSLTGVAILVYFLPNVSKDNKTTGDK
ncbi:synaptic vesicle glycoprotein 2A-like isoform X2 [Vanessa cardui]|uniref:synaptic vesicle glycoprotein 2A-like isoform X2 n=1 Tax=Vanessa cardui TaxID=171605 RepID=UPI001F13EA6B|nr:synaptic vesicle glycoprotein 2A-like isoform X2 [Vanessa cardui]